MGRSPRGGGRAGAEQREEWLDGARYFDMTPLANLRKTQLQLAA